MIAFHTIPIFHSGLHPCAVLDPHHSAHSCAKECGGRTTSATEDSDKKPSARSGISMLNKTPMHCDETSEKTTIALDVAGFSEGQLSVEIDQHVLTIKGERTNKLGDTFVTQRRLSLKSDIYDEDSVSATLNDGILEVVLVKKAVPKTRKVAISVVSSDSSPKADHIDIKDTTTSAPSSEDEVSPPITVPNNEEKVLNTPLEQEDNARHSEKDADSTWEDLVDA